MAVPSETPAVESLSPQDVAAAQPRVGRTPAERLDWAIRFARRDLDDLTRGDWSNLRLELTAFAGVLIREHDVARAARLDALRHLRGGRTGEGVYSEEEVRRLHGEFARIVGGLLGSDRVDAGRYEVTLTIERFPVTPPGATRPVRLRTTFPPGTSQATHVLAHLLGIYGHLVKTCPAPLARSGNEDWCGRWFLAGRPNQVYCCARCQSRATTRAAREAAARGRRRPVARRRTR